MPADERFHDLERDLAAAGDRARSSDRGASPDRGFSGELRGRLLSQLPDRGASPAPERESRPRTGWSLGSLFRVPRFAPALIAASLVFAAAVAGRQLYLAVGSGATPTPAPSVALEPSASEAEPATPSFEPSEKPTAEPTLEPTAVPTPAPTVKPTPVPTPKPTPVPTPVIGSLSLWATTCNGGVLLDWSMYEGGGAFNHYTTLRSTSSEIPAAYPPSGGAVDPGTTYTAYPEKTSGFDAGVDPGVTYYYRAMAFNADDGVIATSSVVSAMGKPVKALGALSVAPVAEGAQLSWAPYGGAGDCFSYYKIAYSETDTTPAYLDGDPYLAAIGDQGASTFTTPDLLSGHTYYIRVQAIRSTHTGSFLVAETDVAVYVAP